MAVEVLETMLVKAVGANKESDNHKALRLAKQLVQLMVEAFHNIIWLLVRLLMLVPFVGRHILDLAGTGQQGVISVDRLDI